MLACAKLGLWQRALEIYHYVAQQEIEHGRTTTPAVSSLSTQSNGNEVQSTTNGANGSMKGTKRKHVFVTDDMVLSLVKACVRASRLRSRRKKKIKNAASNSTMSGDDDDDGITNEDVEMELVTLSPELEEREAALRRIPLDTALEVLYTCPEYHDIPLVAYLVNPLASAYQSLGYIQLSRDILQSMLANRTAGEDEIFNVHDLCAKDKGSYSLLVQGAVVVGDWGAAVEALGDMAKAGLYPNPRHCNVWSEISERQTRPRAVGSWKKKRDDIWTDSVR
jgi:hypothetical protein